MLNLLLIITSVVLTQLNFNTVTCDIIISYKEEQCLEKTGILFQNGEKDLLIARHDFTSGMEMDMTSKQKMYAKYSEEKMQRYDEVCTKYGGMLHTIKLDFFDCKLKGSDDDIELTLKNFANCMADVDECKDFGQVHLLQEAWDELGLHCDEETEETKKDPPSSSSGKNNNDTDSTIAKKEKEAAAKGADEAYRDEKKAEYVPKEERGKDGTSKKKRKKKKGGFLKFILFLSVCGVGYVVFDRRRQGLPINLPTRFFGGSSLLPFGGVSTGSRFLNRGTAGQTGFVSDYNLLSPAEEEINYNLNNELQLSSNLTA